MRGMAVPSRSPSGCVWLTSFLGLVLGLALATSAAWARSGGELPARAEAAFEAARAKTLREPLYGRIDAVWHVDLLRSIRPDPQLRFWANARRRLLSDHATYRLIEPSAPLTELPDDPGRGLDKWSVYMKAPFGKPRALAVRYVRDYLGPPGAAPESGYVLTHQLAVLEWSRMTDLPLPQELWDRKPALLDAIAEEHADDDAFSDLFAERICFLSVYGNPSDEELARSVKILVDAQVEPGVWAPPPVTLAYDGESRQTEVEPEHARKMAMVALAEYLRRVEEASADAGAGADTGAGAVSSSRNVWIGVGVAVLALLFALVRRFRS